MNVGDQYEFQKNLVSWRGTKGEPINFMRGDILTYVSGGKFGVFEFRGTQATFTAWEVTEYLKYMDAPHAQQGGQSETQTSLGRRALKFD